MKPCIFHPEADEEFTEAVDYYAAIRPELGDQLKSRCQYSDGQLDSFADGVITSMTDNAHFTQPTVSVEALLASFGQFRQALAGMTRGGKQATALKDEMRNQMMNLLRIDALQVQNASENELPVLLSSEF